MGRKLFKTRRGKLENRIKEVLKAKKPTIEEILMAVDDYEKNNIKTIDKLKKKKSVDFNKINGALKQTINSHGPITKQYISSATKRIYGALLVDKNQSKKNKAMGWIKFFLIFLLLFLA